MFEELKELEEKQLEEGSWGALHSYIGQFLYNFIRTHNIKRIVETGISWGFSSYYFLAALPFDGELISIERGVKWDKLIVPMKWRNRWKIVEGTSKEKLVEVFRENGDVDFFWHDSSHSYHNQRFEYSTAQPHVTFLGSHDINRNCGHCNAWKVFTKESGIEVLMQDEHFGIGQLT